MVCYPLQVVNAAVPTVPGHKGRFQTPSHDIFQHLAEIVVFGLAFRFVVDAEVDGQVLPVGVRIVERDQVDALHRTVVLARPEMADKRQILAVRLVQHAVVNAQCAAFQVQQGHGFVIQILAFVAFPLQEAGRAIVGNVHDFRQTAATAVFGFAQQETDVHRQGATG